MTNLSDMSYEDFNANFSTMLAKANAEPVEQVEEDQSQEVVEEDQVDEQLEGQEAEEEATEEPEQEAPNPAIEKSVKYFKEQAKREADRAAVAEARLNDLIAMIEKGMDKQPSQEQSKFEPLDEEAHKQYTDRQNQLEEQQKQIQAQLLHQQFNAALQQHEAEARKTMPDFDNAFAHLQNIEIAKLKAMGADEDVARDEVNRALSSTAFVAWQQGKDLGKMFYEMSKSVGYKAASKPTVNHDAIDRNRARTEKRPIKEANPAASGMNLNDRLQSAMKDGRVDPNQFQKILKEFARS